MSKNKTNNGFTIDVPNTTLGGFATNHFATTSKPREKSRINNHLLADEGLYQQAQAKNQNNQTTTEIQNKTPRQFPIDDRFYKSQGKMRQQPQAQFKSPADYAMDYQQINSRSH